MKRPTESSRSYANKPVRLHQLRHGNTYTGGDRFEDAFAEWLRKALERKGCEVQLDRIVANRLFHGWQNFRLLAWAFRNAGGTINIVSARPALPALLKGIFTKSFTICVLHNYDRRDGKSWFLNLYFRLFFFIVKRFSPRRFSIVTVSPFFQNMFTEMFPKTPVFLVPNLFDVSYYRNFHRSRDRKKILFGQVSTKNDEAELARLAEMLTGAGYYCYFLTMQPGEAGKKKYYDIKHLSFEHYLREMAGSYCSLAFTRINEGWPRMVHESILVGTPVIGYDNGGLGDLLKESNSYIVNNADEALRLITGPQLLAVKAPDNFTAKYDVSQAGNYLDSIVKMLEEKRVI